jgi:histone demethylase JARID1
MIARRDVQSQGLNFAEAVNFATPDWLTWGSKCVRQYRAVGRYPVFAHEELLCGLAVRCENLDAQVA